ncbi:phosphatase 2C-like domain-containing protein [Roridomyces roridus]|uniref:Protein phosphatase n=1 Tax=Roridomyces roridus TaxID=1738132 RepID=A0AAD7FQI7_9AGAR|nr:phosphatase 2C-like domain-containing protein [Roridomyces roridus]
MLGRARRLYTSAGRPPYVFHTASQWLEKPPYKDDPPKRRILEPTNPIVQWRQKSLQQHFRDAGDPPSAGEDFFLLTNLRHNSGIALAVADGVGGWANQGVDCSMFSQALMYYASKHFDSTGVDMTPSECMQLAYYDVLVDDTIDLGSSTACLATLNSHSGILTSANLGDSGLYIIRSSSILYHAPPQTHYFNCPRQLAKLKRPRGRNIGAIHDSPSHAETYSTTLKDGDIVILYTDGLVDNVFQAQILEICSLVMKTSAPDETLANSIAYYLLWVARQSMFSDAVTPFEVESSRVPRRRGEPIYRGGKVDDCTVVVALVRET